MPATTSRQNPQEILKQFSGITPTQASSGVTSLPLQMVADAKQALDELGDGDRHIVEPLARAVGWAEALAYAFNTINVPSFGSNSGGNGGSYSRSSN